MHADYSAGNGYHELIGCSFIHKGNKEAFDYQVSISSGLEYTIFRACSALGGGVKAGDNWVIKDCYFESTNRAFSIHNNLNFNTTFGAANINVENCEMVSHGIDIDGNDLPYNASIVVQSMVSNTRDKLTFRNCTTNGYIIQQDAFTLDITLDNTNVKQVWNKSGSSGVITSDWVSLDVTKYIKIPAEISVLKNLNASTITRGKAVKLSGNGFDLFTSSDDPSLFYGILMEDCLSKKSARIKHRGYLPNKYFFSTVNTDVASGLDISVNASGVFIQDSSHVVAITVDNSNVLIN